MPILTEAERVGTTLDGRYSLDAILGRGGMGVVFAGEHLLTGRRVAVKLVRPELGHDPRYAERLFREARAAAALEHPNVVNVLDMGVLDDGGVYLVLERLEGEDLAAALDAENVLSLERTLEVMDPILDALEALHAEGIVHRDLKPSNVFLARRGASLTPKLLDFGLAKLEDGMQSTTTGRLVGTPWYMSPEQAAGAAELGPETDVWAAGAMLYECLAGRRPFEGPTPTAVLMNVLRHDAPALSFPEAPHVAEAIRRAMSKGDDRFRTASELRAALHGREVGASSGVRHASSRTPSVPVTDPNAATLLVAPRNTKARWLAVALVVLAGVVGVVAWPSNEVAHEASIEVHGEPTPPVEAPAETEALGVVGNPPAPAPAPEIAPITVPTDEAETPERPVETASRRPPRRTTTATPETTRRVVPPAPETSPSTTASEPSAAPSTAPSEPAASPGSPALRTRW